MAKSVPMMRSAWRRMYDWGHVRDIVFAVPFGDAIREKSCNNLRRYANRCLRTQVRPRWTNRIPRSHL